MTPATAQVLSEDDRCSVTIDIVLQFAIHIDVRRHDGHVLVAMLIGIPIIALYVLIAWMVMK
jgi:hypothetical protein